MELLNDNGKQEQQFRNYDENLQTDLVRETYKLMHENQTVDFVKGQHEKWLKFNHTEMEIMDGVMLLDDLVDASDPDIDLPNSVHAFQTAERIREKHPDKDWFQLAGLIHDLGKVMALWGEPQWAVVGDTFPVGCRFQETNVFHDSFLNNPDNINPKYNTEYGMYEKGCGLENILMSWGHDEYMYQVLVENNCTLPEEALYMIRFHSFYPYHTSNSYRHLCDFNDGRMLSWLVEFQSFDLYSKSNEIPDVDVLKPYYQNLINKYLPGKIRF